MTRPSLPDWQILLSMPVFTTSPCTSPLLRRTVPRKITFAMLTVTEVELAVALLSVSTTLPVNRFVSVFGFSHSTRSGWCTQLWSTNSSQ